MSETVESLRQQSDTLHNRYSFAFAGKPRATRRLADLDAIVRDADAILTSAKRNGNADIVALTSERAGVYRTEREAIATAQAGGPLIRAAAVLATRANFTFGLYRRHFAGKQRRTRDTALLDEVIGLLETIRSDLSAIAMSISQPGVHEDLEVITRNIDQYRTERAAIEAARGDGTLEERAAALGERANAQFELYRVHFAGRARLSRRPSLIRRLIAGLEQIEREMVALSEAGLAAEFNLKNRDIVVQRRETYVRESAEITKVRETTDVDALISALAEEANAIMKAYNDDFAGKDRATRNLALLGQILDRMGEIERQMWDLDRHVEDPTNARNLGIVHDMMLVYLQEYDRIREAQTN